MSERLGIAGTGAIALGLARLASRGAEVLVWARSEGSAERARGAVGDARVTTDLAELAGAGLVVEAVVEDAGVKSALLAEISGQLADDAVLATTTSSLSVARLAAASGRADRFAALHVFNPVERMQLVELCFPEEASERTRERVHALCEALGKTAVEVPDIPGFVVNRLLFPYLLDAARLLDETGLEPEAVDSCMRLGAAHPMGPLALLDFVGLDVAVSIGESLGVEIPESVRRLVGDGRLGRKSGAGFYGYERSGAAR